MAEKKINTVLYDVDQSSDTTDEQKATARANIGAQAELTAGENIEIDPDTNTISSTSAPQVQADWTESDSTSASYIQNKPSTFLDLLTEDADQITSGANLNDYITPKTYFIPSALDMKEIDYTPYAQMGLSDTLKTGQSQLYVFKTKSSNGRITQLLLTPYSTEPADDNAFGIWYRTSSDNGAQWTDWFRIGDSGITVTSTSVSDGTNTFSQYVHPTTAGNKHVPSGGSDGQFLGWNSDGTAKWVANPASNKVDKVSGKGLSTNDYTNTEKNKLSGISDGANKVQASTTNGNIKIDGTETTVYTHPTTAGNKHIPSGGSTGQVLRYSGSAGTATWSDPIKVVSTITTSTMETGVLYVM